MLNEIRHLIGYDLRALRLPLAIWGAILLAQAIVLVIGPSPDSFQVGPINSSLVIVGIRIGFTITLAALIVQRDALVGTTVFWRTRPISRWRLGTSKVVSAGLSLVAAPCLLTFGVLIALGLRPTGAALGAGIVAAEQAVAVLLAFAVAALTANLTQLALAWMLGVALVFALWTGLVGMLRPSPLWSAVVNWSPGAFMILLVVGTVVVVAHQFLTLRRSRSAGLAAGLFLMATVGGGSWHPLADVLPRPSVDASVLSPGAVTIGVRMLTWGGGRRLYGDRIETYRRLSGFITISGEPDPLLLKIDHVQSALAFGGRPVASEAFTLFAGGRTGSDEPADQDTQPYRSIRAAIGDVDLILPARAMATQTRVQFVSVSDDALGRLNGSGSLEATLQIKAFRQVVAARCPLEVGAALVRRARRDTIVALNRPRLVRALPIVERRTDGLEVAIRSTWSDERERVSGGPNSVYLLHNPSRRQAVILSQYSATSFEATLGLVPGASSVGTVIQYLELDPQRFNASFGVDDQWLGGAELILVEPEDLGVITRPLHVEGVPAPGGDGK